VSSQANILAKHGFDASIIFVECGVVLVKRLLMDDLIKWKNTLGRQPLILKGARQVGKTWLLNEFGRTAFGEVLYINFENAL